MRRDALSLPPRFRHRDLAPTTAALGQVARPASDISFTGVLADWTCPGGVFAALNDEVLSDGIGTEWASPNTITGGVPHSLKMKWGLNHNGAPLRAPVAGSNGRLRVDARAATGAVFAQAHLLDGNGAVRWSSAQWAPPVSVTYNVANAIKLFLIPAANLATVTDWPNAGVQIDATIANAGRRLAVTSVLLAMRSATGAAAGAIDYDFATVGAFGPEWEVMSTTGAVLPVLTIANGRIEAPAAGTYILINHKRDLLADCWSEVTTCPAYNNALVWLGPFIRNFRDGVTPGVDTVRYDVVNNPLAAPAPAFEDKYDGGPSAVLAQAPFAGFANLVAGDRIQTRGVGGIISGRKNGIEIVTADDSARPALGVGHVGTVIAAVGAGPWFSISRLQAATV